MPKKIDTSPGRADRIEAALVSAFSPVSLTVRDDSEQHRGHGGWREEGETHFSVQMVASAFTDQSRVARQRAVHAALEDEFAAGLHALALSLKSPQEEG